MTEIQGFSPVLALLPALIATLILPLLNSRPNLRDIVTIIATILTFLIVAFLMLPAVLAGDIIKFEFFELLPGLSVAFKVDSFGMVFAFVTASLWIATNIYAIGYMRGLKEHAQTRFFVFFTISIFAAMGIAFSGNLLTLFIFYEILSIVTYPLVIHEQDKKSLTGGTEYMIYLMVTSMLLQLLAILMIFGLTGTLEYTDGGFLAGHGGALMLTGIFILLIFGYAKAALFPVHKWLPTAMVAPTPVSALLHAVAVVVAGVFSVMRVVFDVFGPTLMQELNLYLILGGLAAFTLLISLFYGLTQDNLKRRVAYSTVNQLSVMLLGAALLTKAGMTGSIVHIAAHSFGKIILFFGAGAIYVVTHKKLISQLDGIGKQMPITMICFAIGMLAMIATPLTFAYFSKGMMVQGAIAAEYWIFCGVFLLAGILDLIYFFPIVFRAFFRDIPEGEKQEWLEKPKQILGLVVSPIAIVTVFVVLFFFIPLSSNPFMILAENKIANVNPVMDVNEHAQHLAHTAELAVLVIVILFALINYRYFGSSKGKELIRFDTPWIYGGNSLSKASVWSSRKVSNFYYYMRNISYNPAVNFISIFLRKTPEDAKKYSEMSMQSYISSTTSMILLYLIIGIIVLITIKGGAAI